LGKATQMKPLKVSLSRRESDPGSRPATPGKQKPGSKPRKEEKRLPEKSLEKEKPKEKN